MANPTEKTNEQSEADEPRTHNKRPSAAATAGAVLALVTIAVVFLVKYTFGGPGLATTWPLFLICIGVILAIQRYFGLALGLVGFFGLWFAANLGAFSFARAWPFTLIIIAVAVVIEYFRARTGSSPGPQSETRK
jgi:hypothetical protein